jgi:hypothetical protein
MGRRTRLPVVNAVAGWLMTIQLEKGQDDFAVHCRIVVRASGLHVQPRRLRPTCAVVPKWFIAEDDHERHSV